MCRLKVELEGSSTEATMGLKFKVNSVWDILTCWQDIQREMLSGSLNFFNVKFQS